MFLGAYNVPINSKRNISSGDAPILRISPRKSPWKLTAFPFPAAQELLWEAEVMAVPVLLGLTLGLLAWRIPSISASSKPYPITVLRSSRLYFGFALLRTALQNYPSRSILVLSWPVETSEPPSSLPFVTRFSNTLILQECHPWGDKEQKPDKN